MEMKLTRVTQPPAALGVQVLLRDTPSLSEGWGPGLGMTEGASETFISRFLTAGYPPTSRGLPELHLQPFVGHAPSTLRDAVSCGGGDKFRAGISRDGVARWQQALFFCKTSCKINIHRQNARAVRLKHLSHFDTGPDSPCQPSPVLSRSNKPRVDLAMLCGVPEEPPSSS